MSTQKKCFLQHTTDEKYKLLFTKSIYNSSEEPKIVLKFRRGVICMFRIYMHVQNLNIHLTPSRRGVLVINVKSSTSILYSSSWLYWIKLKQSNKCLESNAYFISKTDHGIEIEISKTHNLTITRHYLHSSPFFLLHISKLNFKLARKEKNYTSWMTYIHLNTIILK